MMRKLVSALICLVLVFSLPVTAKADMGPKPSVRITFTGIEGETYYGTLLSERRSTGLHRHGMGGKIILTGNPKMNA